MNSLLLYYAMFIISLDREHIRLSFNVLFVSVAFTEPEILPFTNAAAHHWCGERTVYNSCSGPY